MALPTQQNAPYPNIFITIFNIFFLFPSIKIFKSIKSYAEILTALSSAICFFIITVAHTFMANTIGKLEIGSNGYVTANIF